MKRLIFILVFFSIFLFSSCNKEQKEGKNKDDVAKKDDVFKTTCYIKSEELKKAGFVRLDSLKFYLLKGKESIDYLLNEGDLILSKFKEGKFINSYKASKGQGPGDMIVPKSIFVLDNKIYVYDIQKASFLLFDDELNYLKDIRLDSMGHMEISPIEEGFIGVGMYDNSYNFAILGNNFEVKEKFIPLNKIPADLNGYIFPLSLNKGFIIDKDMVIRTFWHYINKDCEIDIYDIKSKEKKLSLKWEQEQEVNKNDIKDMKNIYSFSYMQKAGNHYIVQTHFTKYFKAEPVRELLIFNLNGKLIRRIKNFSYDFVKIVNNNSLYFIDDKENLISLKINIEN